MYRYTDMYGKARFVYSWTLTKTDRTPEGKPVGTCLRDLEKQLEKDLNDEIDTFSSRNYTLNDYFEKYMAQKRKLKPTTRRIYRQAYDVYLRNRIGERGLSTLKYSDILRCYNDIMDEHGISPATMENVDTVLKPVLRMAVRDNLIRSNPAIGALADVCKEREDTSVKRCALTLAQQEIFLNFVSSSNVYSKWKNMFTVMLGTGCRIGEICGLTWEDCDLENEVIHIRRTLCYSADEYTGKYKFSIQTPKSDCGIRDIPMFSDVKNALQKERIKQLKEGFCTDTVDGVSGFVFCNHRRGVLMPINVNSTLTRLVNTYNNKEKQLATKDKREPILLPNISPHIFRHTFCTRLCECGMNIKVIQNVMGHSKISITLDIYNSVTDDFKVASFKNFDGMIKVV